MAVANCTRTTSQVTCGVLATAAETALIEEALLTPKPALVDRRGNGAHRDLNLKLMLRSARALREAFEEIAWVSFRIRDKQLLRDQLGEIGRAGEARMLKATAGAN